MKGDWLPVVVHLGRGAPGLGSGRFRMHRLLWGGRRWAAPALRLGVGALLVATLMAAESCKQEEVIIKTADGRSLNAEQVDADPLALLPEGAIGVAYLSLQQFYASQFGQQARSVTEKLVPVPRAASFDPARDLLFAYLGLYSMQGVDVVAVVRGSFDREAIERASENGALTPLGVPLSRNEYAGRKLYTVRNLGFVVLTGHTALFGNQTGMRRALDRIEEGRVARGVPAWAADLLENPAAPLVGAMDLKQNPLSSAATASAPFLAGLSRVRVLGNFEAPGLNLAATAVYPDPAGAARGAESLRQLNQMAQSWGIFASWLGIPQPIQKLEVEPRGRELDVVLGLDARTTAVLLGQLEGLVNPAGGK